MIDKKITLLAASLSAILVLLSSLSALQYYAEVEAKITPGLTNQERYDQGYQWGCSDVRKGGQPYLKGHPTHTAIFMKGYYAGYVDCSKSSSSSASTRINWGEICRNPIVDFAIAEPCRTLTTSDGFTLTAEGQRVLKCIAGGGLLLLADRSGAWLAAAKQLGPAVGCR
jgi:hypothetical protein